MEGYEPCSEAISAVRVVMANIDGRRTARIVACLFTSMHRSILYRLCCQRYTGGKPRLALRNVSGVGDWQVFPDTPEFIALHLVCPECSSSFGFCGTIFGLWVAFF